MDRLLCEGFAACSLFSETLWVELGVPIRREFLTASSAVILVSLLGLANANRTLRPAETIDCVGDEVAQVTRYL